MEAMFLDFLNGIKKRLLINQLAKVKTRTLKTGGLETSFVSIQVCAHEYIKYLHVSSIFMTQALAIKE